MSNDTLTDEIVNERLARFCGWQETQIGWVGPDGRPWSSEPGDCPDYLNDGNAMLELLEALRAKGWAYRLYDLTRSAEEVGDRHECELVHLQHNPKAADAEAPPRAVALAAIKVIEADA